ncbi:hypothetical protein QUF72_23175 [Desulfobacterales bacterium HSG2]|nr:hypothetical protein [Desulfobacterales bacterium HSG2]
MLLILLLILLLLFTLALNLALNLARVVRLRARARARARVKSKSKNLIASKFFKAVTHPSPSGIQKPNILPSFTLSQALPWAFG